MTTETNKNSKDWSMVCHLDYGSTGNLVVVKQKEGEISVSKIENGPAAGGDILSRQVFLGVNSKHQVLMLDPSTRQVQTENAMPADARAAYAYRDPKSVRIWYMQDGDKDGNDTLCCDTGASMTVAAPNNGGADFVETLCVGRGHHVVTFVYPTKQAGNLPARAFASNLQDGSISVIGNDPNDAVSFLKVIATINLGDPRCEENADVGIPNNAFPHGQEFSAVTGKLYCLNNGYGTIAVIDPMTHEVEDTIPMKVSSNLLQSRCGRYLIGKGADRKANPEHVMGRLSVVDAVKGEMSTTLDLQDIYPSVYRFNPDGSKLYVTTAATGKDVQRDNLRTNVVQVYDTRNLPELTLLKEIELDATSAGRVPIAFIERGNETPYVLVPNPSAGTLSIIDGGNDAVIDTIELGEGGITEFTFSFWNQPNAYGA